MEVMLTKDACLVLAVAYSKYESRRKEGIDRTAATQFQFLSELNCKETAQLDYADMQDALSELESHGLMKVYNLDFKLTPTGIAASEHQIREKYRSVKQWITAIVGAAEMLIPLLIG